MPAYALALVLGGWLGPLVVIAAVLLGGLCLTALDRFEARRPTTRRRRARGGLTARGLRAHGSPYLWADIIGGRPARYDDHTIERIRRTRS